MTDIVIRRLSPDLIEDYVRFFDATPHADGIVEHRCYCVWWCSDPYVGQDLTSSPDVRREYAIARIKAGDIQGYLAYAEGQVIGWCNANTKSDCLECYCWQRFMGEVPVAEGDDDGDARVKSIYCLAVAPAWRRKGIASRLVARVCADAAAEGFDVVEAYPNIAFVDEAEDFMGPAELYVKAGFGEHARTEQKRVMRRHLEPSHRAAAPSNIRETI